MKVTDGKRELNVTEKAYRVVYESLGYKPAKGGNDNGKAKEGHSKGHETQAEQEAEGQSKARSSKGQKKKG